MNAHGPATPMPESGNAGIVEVSPVAADGTVTVRAGEPLQVDALATALADLIDAGAAVVIDLTGVVHFPLEAAAALLRHQHVTGGRLQLRTSATVQRKLASLGLAEVLPLQVPPLS